MTIDGLTGGAAADVAITGPGSFARRITASTVLEDLKPGNYTLAAAPVAGHVLAGSAEATAEVVAGAQASAAFAYVAGGFALAPDGAAPELTLGGSQQLNLTLKRLGAYTGAVTVTALAPAGLELSPAEWKLALGQSTLSAVITDVSAPLGASTVRFAATGLMDGVEVSYPLDVEVTLRALVTTTADVAPGTPGTLRYLVNDARTEAATITFDPTLFATPTRIELVEELLLEHDLTIEGPAAYSAVLGPNVMLDGNLAIRPVSVTAGASVTLANLEITNGKALHGGGALVAAGAELTLRRAVVRFNEATQDGGGVYSHGTLVVDDSRIFGNVALRNGAGVWVGEGAATFTDAAVSNNQATALGSRGGGIYLGKGILEVVNSEVMRNEAGLGGGIFANNNNWRSDLSALHITGSKVYSNAAVDGAGVHSYAPATIENSAIEKNTATGSGAGVRNHLTMEMIATTIAENVAAERYGGVFNDGVMIIRGSWVLLNRAGTDGGGIFNGYHASDALGELDKGMLIERTVIEGNVAGRNGGGVHSIRRLLVFDSTIHDNRAGGHGAGIYSVTIPHASTADGGGELHLSGSTISNNVASGNGGGLYSDTVLDGGYLGRPNAPLMVANSTFSGNQAGFGGGILMAGINSGQVRLAFSTIAGNRAVDTDGQGGGIHSGRESVVLRGNIVAGNSSVVGGRSTDLYHSLGHVTSDGYNLFGASPHDSVVLGSADIHPANPELLALADNGGETRTMALSDSSPAIDKVPSAHCVGPDGLRLYADQRGKPRGARGSCAIGAYEWQP